MRGALGLLMLSVLLTFGGGAVATAGPSAGGTAEGVAADAPAVVQRGAHQFGIRDEAAMVLVGTILIGLAGAVRRAA